MSNIKVNEGVERQMNSHIYDSEIWSDIIHLLPAWTWETDKDYRLSHVQLQFSRLAGVDSDALIGHSILGSGPPQPEEHGLELYLSNLRAQVVIDSACYQRVLVDGSPMVILDNAVPRHDETGTFLGYRGVSINVSEIFRKTDSSASLVNSLQNRADSLEKRLSHSKAELLRSNRLLSGILDAMGEGILVTSGRDIEDSNNRILLFNPAYKALFELGDGDISVGMEVGEYLNSLVKSSKLETNTRSLGDISQELEEGRPMLMGLPDLNKHYSVKSTPGPSGGYVLVHTDVTDLQQRNAALIEARDAAEAANNTKSAFLATMSHEIRTPMNGIVGMTELLSETRLDTEQADYVRTIRDAALALTGLISDILDFSKIEAGQMALNLADFDLRELCAQIIDLMQPLADAKMLTLGLVIDQEVAQSVRLDPLRLRQILLNLLGNAVKFTEQGDVTLFISSTDAGILVIRVEDTGIGIAEEQFDDVFNAFAQGQAGPERQFDGTGLGLTITRKLVTAMNGTIQVESELGKGTAFEVRVPFDIAETQESKVAQTLVLSPDLDDCHVLLVEDNATNQLVVRRMLERAGLRVSIAHNGQAALSLYEPERFDLVFMDISMPVMTGLEASQKIRERERQNGWSRCPIVALTGNAFERDRDAAMQAGMDDFLTKPVRRDSLLSCLMKHIGQASSAAAE